MGIIGSLALEAGAIGAGIGAGAVAAGVAGTSDDGTGSRFWQADSAAMLMPTIRRPNA